MQICSILRFSSLKRRRSYGFVKRSYPTNDVLLVDLGLSVVFICEREDNILQILTALTEIHRALHLTFEAFCLLSVIRKQ